MTEQLTNRREGPRQLAALQQSWEGVLAALLWQQLHHIQRAVCQEVVHHQRQQLAARATGQSCERAVTTAGGAGGRGGEGSWGGQRSRGGGARVQAACAGRACDAKADWQQQQQAYR